jgi:hypothetical protein
VGIDDCPIAFKQLCGPAGRHAKTVADLRKREHSRGPGSANELSGRAGIAGLIDFSL